MNKIDYIKKKLLLAQAQKENKKNHRRETCLKCNRPKRACFCQYISPFKTNTKFCILMHPLEAKTSHVGTGRLASLAMLGSEILIDRNFNSNKRFNELLNSEKYNPFLLYPGEKSFNLDQEGFDSTQIVDKNKTPLIFILDGTWPCAKSMMRDTDLLHNLPKISFDNKYESRFEIKQQPAKYCLSTIESIYYLLSGLEKVGLEKIGPKKETLLNTLTKIVEFHQECAADPLQNNYHRDSAPPKKSSNRIASKKWETRRICFKSK